jgi:hypothetical protein
MICHTASEKLSAPCSSCRAVNSPRDSSDLHSRIPDCCISLDGRLAAAALAECCQRGLAACAIPAAPGRGRNAGTSTDQSQNGDHPGRRGRSARSRWNRRIATWGLELLVYTRVQGSGRRLSSWRHPHPAQAITACSRARRRGGREGDGAGDAAPASRPRCERGRRPWLCRCSPRPARSLHLQASHRFSMQSRHSYPVHFGSMASPLRPCNRSAVQRRPPMTWRALVAFALLGAAASPASAVAPPGMRWMITHNGDRIAAVPVNGDAAAPDRIDGRSWRSIPSMGASYWGQTRG